MPADVLASSYWLGRVWPMLPADFMLVPASTDSFELGCPSMPLCRKLAGPRRYASLEWTSWLYCDLCMVLACSVPQKPSLTF